MTQSKGFRSVSVSGSSRSMGEQLGEECEDLARSMIVMMKGRLKLLGLSLTQGKERASKFLPYAEEYDPEYTELLKGYAEAAGLDFEELFVHFCLDEKGFCTDIAVNADASSDGSVLSVHTEDWAPEYAGKVVMIRAKPRTGPEFIAFSLCGAEIDCGMNSDGISFTGNSLYPDDTRVGIPKMFNARKILASRTLGDAVQAAFPDRRASSYNHNICHESGEMYSIEGSATDFEVIPPEDGLLVHTNHYISPRMSRHDTIFSSPSGRSPGNAPSTLLRLHRARNLARRHLGDISTDTLKSITRDHFNHPHSICAHVDESHSLQDRCATIFSVVFDLTKLETHVCPTNPCSGVYEKHGMGDRD